MVEGCGTSRMFIYRVPTEMKRDRLCLLDAVIGGARVAKIALFMFVFVDRSRVTTPTHVRAFRALVEYQKLSNLQHGVQSTPLPRSPILRTADKTALSSDPRPSPTIPYFCGAPDL